MASATRLDRTAARVTPSRIRYEDSDALEYGNGPDALLERKFEETNSGSDENAYDNYARVTLMDRTADTTTFAHEETRNAINRPSAALQLRYYGHRGCEDVERPELFLGMHGPEQHDPRGINVDPDMRKFVAQNEARNRFVRFTPDDSAFVTGGGRSQGQLMADQQTLQRWTRDRLKVFERQMDGRREGMRRTQAQTQSVIGKTVTVQAYGDLIADYALNPQRRANLICRQAIRNSRAWRDGTADQDFEIARYTQICRRAGGKQTFRRVLEARGADDTVWDDADSTIPFKTMGILMANLIAARKGRSDVIAASDRDYGDAVDVQIRKTAPLTRDLEAIMYAVATGAAFGASDETSRGKTPGQQQAAHLARVADASSHMTPAHHVLNAEIIYKSLRQGGDLSKIQQQVVGDGKATETTEDVVTAAKSVRRRLATGAKLSTAQDTDRNDAVTTVMSYKSLKPSKTAPVMRTDSDATKTESDAGQARRTPGGNYRTTNAADVQHGMMFLDNTAKERRVGPMGTKYTFSKMDRDGDDMTLSELS